MVERKCGLYAATISSSLNLLLHLPTHIKGQSQLFPLADHSVSCGREEAPAVCANKVPSAGGQTSVFLLCPRNLTLVIFSSKYKLHVLRDDKAPDHM